jgi:hypothetical protein
MRVQVGRGEPEPGTTLCTTLHPALHAIGTSQQSSCKIHPAFQQQFPNLAGADALIAELHLGDLVGKKPQFRANAPQQFDISFSIVTESEATPKVNFFCVQSILNHVRQKIFSPNLRKLLIEANYDRLFNTEHTKPFNFLIQSLQERRRRFRMQDGTRMWIESYDGGNRSSLTRSFYNGAHD